MLVALACAAGGVRADEVTGYEPLADWASLPRAKTGVVAGLLSSYDRSGGNDDFNYYESPEGLQTGDVDTVVATLAGPGVLTRFWMPHAAAGAGFPVKVTIDGTKVIDTDSDTLLGGSYAHMASPLVQTLIGGQVSYEPIAFAESVVIESANYAGGGWAKEHHYYQWGYRQLTSGQTVTPYTETLSAAQQAGRTAAANLLSHAGVNPAGVDPSATVLSAPANTIAPGEALAVASVIGAGRIRRLSLKMDNATDADLDGLSLRVRYDGRAGAAIDVPVSHFFGAGHERADYASLPLGADAENSFYCYWPMPFRRQVTVELVNRTGSPIAIASAEVEYVAGGVSDKDAYLHAVVNQQTLPGGQAGQFHTLLDVTGAGHYVGNLLWLRRDGTARGILEGDDVIVVDGRTLYGTGLEDAYNGGYYYNHVAVQDTPDDPPRPESGTGSLHGLLHMDDADFGDGFVRTDQYRWLISDAVPFTDHILVSQEHYHNATDAAFGSTAFYYLLPDPPLGGDANFDGEVGIADLVSLADHYGQADAGWMGGDFNDDGTVGIADLCLLADHYGQAEAGTVPAPPAAAWMAAGTGLLARRRRRRRRDARTRIPPSTPWVGPSAVLPPTRRR